MHHSIGTCLATVTGMLLLAVSCTKDGSDKAPITTTDAVSVSFSKATVGGKVDIGSKEMATAGFGIIYSTEEIPTADNGKVVASRSIDVATGQYTVSLSGLASGTEYFYRAYLEIGELTYLGSVMSFTTEAVECDFATLSASDISETKATMNGTIDTEGIESLEKSVWFLYSSTESTMEGLKANGKRADATLSDNGRFSVQLSSLELETEYHFAALGKVYDTDLCGEVLSFSTASFSVSVATDAASSINETKATLKGQVTVSSIEKFSATAAFYYSMTETTAEGLIGNGTKVSVTPSSSGEISASLTGLKYNTRYRFIAVAEAKGKQGISEMREFSTKDIAVTVTTGEASSITETKAQLSGTVTNQAGSSYTPMASIYYSATETTPEGLVNNGTKVSCTIGTNGAIQASIANLSAGTQYSYMASATVAGARINGQVRTFSTADFTPTVTTGAASEIGGSTARVTATVQPNSIDPIPSSLIEVAFYYSTTSGTAESLIATGTKVSAKVDSGYTYTTVISGLSNVTTYYFVAMATVAGKKASGDVGSFTTIYVPTEAVDLGLSVMWCSRNLGADTAEQGGAFYSWGETATKTSFDWSTYSLCNGSENTLKSYCGSTDFGTVDGLSTLQAKDDAASGTLGNGWRMPTSAEMNELRQECTWTWTKQNSVYGYKVTGKNGNHIFIPATGYYDGGGNSTSGTCGMYWCSDLMDGNDNYAVRLYFHETGTGRSYGARCLGYAIRPVFNGTK